MGTKMARLRGEALNEWTVIAELRRSLSRVALPAEVSVAIGDDAAVLECSESLVWSIDSSVEGTHFDLAWLSVGAAAARAFSAAASDLAAMGAQPLGALCNVQLPAGCSMTAVRDIARAQSHISGHLKCPIVGGNISRGREYQFTTSVLGKVSRPLLRSGARVGDELWLFGGIGEAAAGLKALQRATRGPRKRFWRDQISAGGGAEPLARAARRCVRAWRSPVARIDQGMALRNHATACLDLSDGLASDAAHLARASGVEIVFDPAKVRRALSPAFRLLAAALQSEPLKLAMTGGEDYALLATGPASRRPPAAKVLGRVSAGDGMRWEDGSAVTPQGYDHLVK